MAKVIMFIRHEISSKEKERNNNFRNKVKEITKLMLNDGFTCAEYSVNTPAGYQRAFDENKDCELVFTTENDSEAQYQAGIRDLPVMEWRCFSDDKISLVKVSKTKMDDAATVYKTTRTH